MKRKNVVGGCVFLVFMVKLLKFFIVCLEVVGLFRGWRGGGIIFLKSIYKKFCCSFLGII